MIESALTKLVDRQAIVDVVVQYATGVDRRDWELYAACFTDPCEFDFSGWRGQPVLVTSPADWTAKVRATNGNFDATQHLSTNHVISFASTDEATCVSTMHAQHWYSADRLAELGFSRRRGPLVHARGLLHQHARAHHRLGGASAGANSTSRG